jgi:hypothetical protein
MKVITLIVIFFASTSLMIAQTKLIAHKSHSGSNYSFHTSINSGTDGLGFGGPIDYGDLLTKIIVKEVVDSVVYVSDTVSVLSVKEYYTMSVFGDSILVAPIKDTVYHSSSVSKDKDTLDFIIKVRYSYYSYSRDSVKFVGYDQKPLVKHKKKKKGFVFVPIRSIDHGSPFDFHLLFYVGCVALFSILAGVMSWKLYQVKLLVQKV